MSGELGSWADSDPESPPPVPRGSSGGGASVGASSSQENGGDGGGDGDTSQVSSESLDLNNSGSTGTSELWTDRSNGFDAQSNRLRRKTGFSQLPMASEGDLGPADTGSHVRSDVDGSSDPQSDNRAGSGAGGDIGTRRYNNGSGKGVDSAAESGLLYVTGGSSNHQPVANDSTGDKFVSDAKGSGDASKGNVAGSNREVGYGSMGDSLSGSGHVNRANRVFGSNTGSGVNRVNGANSSNGVNSNDASNGGNRETGSKGVNGVNGVNGRNSGNGANGVDDSNSSDGANGTVRLSKSQSPRVLGPKGFVKDVETSLEQEIINESSPLLHRLEDSLLGDSGNTGYTGGVSEDPDEPDSSSPYDDPLNSLSIRSLRVLLYVLTTLWSGWITLLIINVFSHISWLDEPSVSSAFTQLDMALMSLAQVISSLMFFRNTNSADRSIEYVTTAIVLLDLVVVLAVPSQRIKNGSKGGLITTVGSLVTFVLTPLTDRVVEYAGKRRDEGRIHQSVRGLPINMSSFSQYARMTALFFIRGLILVSVALISTNMVLETYDSAVLQPPGKIIPISLQNITYSPIPSPTPSPPYSASFFSPFSIYDESTPNANNNDTTTINNSTIGIHIYCTDINKDTTNPNLTVLLETGDSPALSFSSWALELHERGDIAQVCYWDRPGFGFSDQAPSPLSAGVVANILFETLNRTLDEELPSKYVLVSHDVGGLYSRIFASRHCSSIHSMVLVDNLHEDLFFRRNSPWQGFKYWIQGVFASLGYRNAFGIIFKREGPFHRVYGSAYQRQPKYFFAKLQEQLSARTRTKSEIIDSNASLASDIPILVITSSASIRTDSEWSDKQRQLTKLTSNTLAWEILDGPHDLWRNDATKHELQKLLLDDIKYSRRS
ncbi:hypothetical protein AWJ20_4058 [Sugiyamaella lignohabitans]|uniref:AB hydrolase-1 domain-containing protein n=1 Tax=Sugiyamaella lignohabitans TaxID=796027 RepID=A0A167C5T4_9ASCO|nr:uncharacterized protein AWJ20_4058 [Sugiyamaella lignohabitans]ANB11255.1 hypothetical protein AWJ20_4058 [Sugiyamaella lignohabitans]